MKFVVFLLFIAGFSTGCASSGALTTPTLRDSSRKVASDTPAPGSPQPPAATVSDSYYGCYLMGEATIAGTLKYERQVRIKLVLSGNGEDKLTISSTLRPEISFVLRVTHHNPVYSIMEVLDSVSNKSTSIWGPNFDAISADSGDRFAQDNNKAPNYYSISVTCLQNQMPYPNEG
jgi:hypothetical protein